MFRRRTRSTSSMKPEILAIGEQLRLEMKAQGLIANRKYHLRSYKSCFVGKDVVDWLLKSRHMHSREAAITAMRILQENFIFHHVCDDHEFKDEKLFYRFRREDDSYIGDRDLNAFYTGLRIFNKVKKRRDVMRDYNQSDHLFCDAFTGFNLVSWMIETEEAYSREHAVRKGRELLESEIIKHVTDDYHFRDSQYKYQFCIDFTYSYLLSDIFRLQRNGDRSTSSSSNISIPINYSMSNISRKMSVATSSDGSPDQHSILTLSQSPEHSDTSSEADKNNLVEPKSVLIRQVSVSELEDPSSPYKRQKIKITSDGVGYGFVIRGDGPTYVQTIDPCGPAALAGLKVRQYILSINDVRVLDKDHKYVGRLIRDLETISLVVLSYYKERC